MVGLMVEDIHKTERRETQFVRIKFTYSAVDYTKQFLDVLDNIKTFTIKKIRKKKKHNITT